MAAFRKNVLSASSGCNTHLSSHARLRSRRLDFHVAFVQLQNCCVASGSSGVKTMKNEM